MMANRMEIFYGSSEGLQSISGNPSLEKTYYNQKYRYYVFFFKITSVSDDECPHYPFSFLSAVHHLYRHSFSPFHSHSTMCLFSSCSVFQERMLSSIPFFLSFSFSL